MIVNMIRPTGCKTFSDYALQKILPYVEFQLKRVNRVDIVWDTYKEHSLKAHTRTQRGKGVRRMVTGNVCVPHNWQEFLWEDRNKVELFAFLAMHIEAIQTDKTVITTHNEHAAQTHTIQVPLPPAIMKRLIQECLCMLLMRSIKDARKL